MTSDLRPGRVQLMRWREASLAAALFIAAVATGCGDGKPYHDTSLNEATVTGVVTAKGAPVTEGGTILFNPSNSGRIVPTRTAPIGSDGRYTIKTYTGDNVVTYGGEVAMKYPGLGLRRDYADVKAGENNIDFDVVGEGKNPTIDVSKMPTRKKRR